MDEVTIRDARIVFRNFAGRQTMYNREGDRNFSVVLSGEQAEELRALGWNAKSKEGNPDYVDEGDDGMFHHLKITVGFKFRPPAIWIVTRQGTKKTRLPEDLVDLIDSSQFEKIDLTFRPRKWEHSGRSGVTAYLRTFYGTLREDPLDIDYQDVEEENYYIPLSQEEDERKALPAGSSEDADTIDYEYDGSRAS